MLQGYILWHWKNCATARNGRFLSVNQEASCPVDRYSTLCRFLQTPEICSAFPVCWRTLCTAVRKLDRLWLSGPAQLHLHTPVRNTPATPTCPSLRMLQSPACPKIKGIRFETFGYFKSFKLGANTWHKVLWHTLNYIPSFKKNACFWWKISCQLCQKIRYAKWPSPIQTHRITAGGERYSGHIVLGD